MKQVKKTSKATPKECRDNVYNRFTALQQALISPSLAPRELLNACVSQSTLAELEYVKLGISPISRNSMYKYADDVLAEHLVQEGKTKGETGRYYLDWLRKQVLEKSILETRNRTKFARQKRIRASNVEHDGKLVATEKAMLAMEKAYWHLFQSILKEVKANNIDSCTRDRLANVLNHHSETYHHILDAVPDEVLPDNVESIKK